MHMKNSHRTSVSFGFRNPAAIFYHRWTQNSGGNGKAGDESWQQELLKEREQKDIEFKTSATSPMAGSMRLTISAAEKTFIMIIDGNVILQPEGGAGAVFRYLASGKVVLERCRPGCHLQLGRGRALPKTPSAAAGKPFQGRPFHPGRLSRSRHPGPDRL